MPFSHLPAPISEALSARGYAEPTAVQAAVLEPEARGRDLIVSARTGSGKTVAFGVAMANELFGDRGMLPDSYSPSALVIAPTRELALQVSEELGWLYGKAGARIATCVGGMNIAKERRALANGADIVVGTPGRLRDHVERRALDLSEIAFVVLDEADEMLDMGFRDDLEAILDETPATRRTLLFSATMPKPILALAGRYQRDALRISTIDERQGHGDITYQMVTVSPSEIEDTVVNLLRYHDAETAMLFCATRDNVRQLHAALTDRGFTAVALSGEHSQNERNHALQALRDGRARVCVATDVAARGIDVATISLVVHVEVPRDAEVLQHRSGRTGRAGRKGTAVLIVPHRQRRRVESMLRGARVQCEWTEVPSAEDIRERDRERLLTALSEPFEASDAERAVAERILAEKSPMDIALTLVRAYSESLPEPVEQIRSGKRRDHEEEPRAQREGFDDVLWYRMNIGRNDNADPRWILPLICRRGGISRNEIGAIRIGQNESWFQIPRAVETSFRAELLRTERAGAEDSDRVTIEPSPEAPTDTGFHNTRKQPRGANRSHHGAPKGEYRGSGGDYRGPGGRPGNDSAPRGKGKRTPPKGVRPYSQPSAQGAAKPGKPGRKPGKAMRAHY